MQCKSRALVNCWARGYTVTGVLLLALALASFNSPAFAQTFVDVRPDCQIFFHFTVTGSVIAAPTSQPQSPNQGLDNRTVACSVWSVAVSSSGITAFSVILQSAPNNAGAPGTWVTYLNQQLIIGTNPLTGSGAGAAASVYIQGFNPWVRVLANTATGTGTIDGVAFGWAIPSAGSSSAAAANVNVADWGGTGTSLGQKAMASSVPVTVASDQSQLSVNLAQVAGTNTLTGGVNGSQGIGGLAAVGAAPSGNPIPEGLLDSAGNMITPDYCTLKAVFSTSGSGNTQLVAVSGSTTIRVCHVDFSGDTLTIAKLVTGTGATCTSSANETGVFTGAGGGMFGFAMDYASPLITTAAKTLCLNLSAGSTGGGTIIYSQR